MPQTQLLGVIVQCVDAHEPGGFKEEVVTGVFQSTAHIQKTVSAPLVVPDPTSRSIAAGGIVGVNAFVPDLGGSGDGAAFQSGQGGHRFEGGTGRIGAHGGPVEHGFQRVVIEHLIILVEGGQVVSGIRGTGQDAAGVDVDDHRSAAFHIPAAAVVALAPFFDGLDGAGQRLFGHGLQIQVQRQDHIASRLRFLGLGFIDNIPVDVGFHRFFSVNAPEIGFIGFFQAVFANGVVEAIALVFQLFVLFPVDLPHPAQYMGGISGVILTHIVHRDGDAGHLTAPLFHQGYRLHIHLTGEGVQVVVGGELLLIHFISDTGDEAGLGVGE